MAAHPDDEIIGCGGTIAKISTDNNVQALILGEGMISRDLENKENLLQILKDDAIKAQKTIGVNESYFENFPDNSFDTVPLLEIIKKVEEFINKINPDIIFTHHNADLNVDHRITFQAVLTTCRPNLILNTLIFTVLKFPPLRNGKF